MKLGFVFPISFITQAEVGKVIIKKRAQNYLSGRLSKDSLASIKNVFMQPIFSTEREFVPKKCSGV